MVAPNASEDDYDASPFVPERAGIRALRAAVRPTTEVINACHPWLDAELALVRPEQIRDAITETLALAVS